MGRLSALSPHPPLACAGCSAHSSWGGGAANLCKTWVWGPFYICLQLPKVKSRDAACLVSTFWSSSVRQVSRRPWLPVCSLLCVQPGLHLVYSGCALRTWNGGSPVRAPPACLSHPRRFLSSEPCHPYHFCLCRAWHRPSFYPGALSLPSEVELRYTGGAVSSPSVCLQAGLPAHGGHCVGENT